jgi:hypothetical protein
MLVELTFNDNGQIAFLRERKFGLIVAKFLVHGPFKRNADSVAKGFDDMFSGVIRGIGDNEYIDERTKSIKVVRDG